MENLFGIIIILFFFLTYKIVHNADKNYYKSDAAKWERKVRESTQRDYENYLAKKQKKKELLHQADMFDDQSRYGSIRERRELKKQAEDLRRKAGRL